MPKSVMTTRPVRSIRMLAGLRSRWITPAACAAVRPSATARAKRAARTGSIAWSRVSPSGRADADDVVERLALDELHGDVVGAGELADVVGAGDVGVADAPSEADLAAEPLEVLRGAGDVGVEDLEGDDVADDDVDRAKHGAHAAAADEAFDAVATGIQGSRRRGLLATSPRIIVGSPVRGGCGTGGI
jgi:hypothetical protein